MTGRSDDEIDEAHWPKMVESWRLSIQHANVQLGTFNWPWALGLALDRLAAETARADENDRLWEEACKFEDWFLAERARADRLQAAVNAVEKLPDQFDHEGERVPGIGVVTMAAQQAWFTAAERVRAALGAATTGGDSDE